MNLKDPKLTALQFNDWINNQDIEGLSHLSSKNHIFINGANEQYREMVNGWKDFFCNFSTI
jgi:hypothetical protein